MIQKSGAAEPPREVADAMKSILPERARICLDVVFALRATTQNLENVFTGWLAESEGVTLSRFQCLAVLWAAGRPVPQMTVVRALKVSRASVSNLVAALVREGDVEVVEGAADRRESHIALTASGRARIERLIRRNGDRLETTMTLPTADLATLAATLRGLLEGER